VFGRDTAQLLLQESGTQLPHRITEKPSKIGEFRLIGSQLVKVTEPTISGPVVKQRVDISPVTY